MLCDHACAVEPHDLTIDHAHVGVAHGLLTTFKVPLFMGSCFHFHTGDTTQYIPHLYIISIELQSALCPRFWLITSGRGSYHTTYYGRDNRKVLVLE